MIIIQRLTPSKIEISPLISLDKNSCLTGLIVKHKEIFQSPSPAKIIECLSTSVQGFAWWGFSPSPALFR
jgi:hypothetical protein